jgi:hypothetical protein
MSPRPERSEGLDFPRVASGDFENQAVAAAGPAMPRRLAS